MTNLTDMLILQWIDGWGKYLEDNEDQHNWDGDKYLGTIWKGVLSSKYLSIKLIRKIFKLMLYEDDETQSFLWL